MSMAVSGASEVKAEPNVTPMIDVAGAPDPGGFEEAWQREVHRRYNIVVWLVAGGGWGLLAVVVVALALTRKRRDRPRRAALDIGWPVPEGPELAEGNSLDRDRPDG